MAAQKGKRANVRQSPPADDGPAAPFFRAINVDGKRKGFRLEKSYWMALEKLSAEEGISAGEFIGRIADRYPGSRNLSSLLRVFVVDSLGRKLDELRAKASAEALLKGINACPSPVFVLSGARQLRGYNAAFLRYVRANFVFEDDHPVSNSLRLQIDMSTADLIKRLKEANEGFVTIGFVIGMENRRVRGRINAMLAPSWREDLIVGYVIS